MNTPTNITKLAIVGEQIVTNETEASEAARVALDWNGSSEGDSKAECCVVEKLNEDDEITGYEVVETWGAKANRNDDSDSVLASFQTEAEANTFADAHNAAALASWSKCDWITLPRPIDFVYFGGCANGQYPQSRIATVTATAGEEKFEVSGFGNATYLRDTHNHAALEAAVEKLVEALAK